MLADLGAEVVKIERPDGGDELRSVFRYEGREDHEDYFNANNRSKKSITLNLKNPRERIIAYDLVRFADAVVENFAPGTADSLGMGWRELQPLNPKLIYCSISGFGQSGPYRDRVGLDPIIQAVSGVMSVTGVPGGDPMQIGAPVADVIAGMFAAYSIVGALHAVRRGEEGRQIDVSLQDAMLATLGPRMGEVLQADILPQRLGNENPMRVPANTYRTANDKYLTVIVQNDRYWASLCRAAGLQKWMSEERFKTMSSRLEHREELNEIFAKRFAERTAEEWVPRLKAENVPYAVVNSYSEALSDQQVRHRGLIRELNHPTSGRIRVVGPPWIMSGDQAESKPPPLLGEHTGEILREWIGWDEDQITRFQNDREKARNSEPETIL
jgi:crotonobetainyl-CoA:carnitine CoA-transferase CaiB-like acyl-CoA transferase